MEFRLRLAAIRFLNPAPLMWDFEHPPFQQELARRYDVQKMMPAQCAERLALPLHDAEAADIGLVPIAAYAETPGLLIIPGCTVASKGAIRSLLLIHRSERPLQAIRKVAADTSSRATFAYVQILFERYWQQPVSYLPHTPDLESMLASCDAAVLIGDPALMALEDRASRESRTGEQLNYVDLGSAWHEFTGLPWVSAFWVVREALFASEVERRQVREDFLRSRDHGLENRDALVQEWSTRIAMPASVIRTYLTENIHYVLDEECIAAIEHFLHLAAECRVLPPAPALRFL